MSSALSPLVAPTAPCLCSLLVDHRVSVLDKLSLRETA
uniref:Uncharacterized protein n=1 Tax=Anguilla anguilla TaxID=7936 RepID=A0A0E9S2Y1_ANGAN